jgi:hypothetical protein
MACRRATSLPRVLLNKGDAQTRSAAAFCSIMVVNAASILARKTTSCTPRRAAAPHVRFGQKRTSTSEIAMSALPPKADIAGRQLDVRFVPKADSCTAQISRRIMVQASVALTCSG